MTEINVLGMINILKTYKMKPNFSELARVYGLDRHTVSNRHFCTS